ncbi:MAG: hypothetical protein BEN19_01060 [Epulopiscium sp. Nuni2H_MBin003]|nr:MAG: hypothetical protein BEN19_01060 [Epulopiscium sp. Nuni2H_MBin003]
MNINAANQYAIASNFGKINYDQSDKSELKSALKKVDGEVILNQNSSLSISAQGKTMSIIDTLHKQKTQLLDQKNELITNVLSKGEDISTIQKDLDKYIKKLSLIDKQITNTIKAKQDEEVTKNEEKMKIYTKEPIIKEETLSKRLMSIAGIVDNLDQTQDITNIKSILDSYTKNSNLTPTNTTTYTAS